MGSTSSKKNDAPPSESFTATARLILCKAGRALFAPDPPRINEWGHGARVAALDIPWSNHVFDTIPNGTGGQIARYYTERFLAATLSVSDIHPRIVRER